MNVDHDNRTATLEDWTAPEYTDIFLNSKVNFDEKAELATVVAMSIGRRDDQIIIDALAAAPTSTFIDTDIGGVGTGMNIAKLRAAKETLDGNNVPESDRNILIDQVQLRQLLEETEVQSSDFNTVKALVQGDINTFLGFNFLRIGNRDEGGLPAGDGGATEARAIAWHRSAIGLAEGLAVRTAIDWMPSRLSHLVNAYFSAGAVAIDDLGIIFIDSTIAA